MYAAMGINVQQGSFVTIHWEDNILVIQLEASLSPEHAPVAKQAIEDFLAQHPPATPIWYRMDLLSPSIVPDQAGITLIRQLHPTSPHPYLAAVVITPHTDSVDHTAQKQAFNKTPFAFFADIHSAQSWLLNQ